MWYRKIFALLFLSVQFGASAKEPIFFWDVDNVLVERDAGALRAMWTYPRKRELLRSLGTGILRGAATTVYSRQSGFRGASERAIALARKHDSPQLEDFICWSANAKRPKPESIAIARQLHDDGFRQYLGTNMGRTLFDDLASRPGFEFFTELFDLVNSQFMTSEGVQEGIYKPRKKYFEDFLSRMNLEPSEVIFIDDSLPNVTAARSLGMRAIHFVGADDLVMRLRLMGINVSLPQ